MRKRQVQLEAEQARLMTQLQARDKAGAERQAVNPGQTAPTMAATPRSRPA